MYFLCVDKPVGYTSHDVISLFRVLTGIKRIGHTGTLDPFATGVLVLAFQDATKLIGHIPEQPKRYQCIVQLGVQTETADCTGEVVQRVDVPTTVQEDVKDTLPQFLGKISQKPPMYSAIKVNGKRLYEYARKGETVEIPSRNVTIDRLGLISEVHGVVPTAEQVAIDVLCSKGTYVRSLGCDIAEAVGTIGHLSVLRRLSSDGFSIEQALNFRQLADIATVEPIEDWRLALSREGRALFPRRSREDILERLMPHRISVETAFDAMPILHLNETESLRLAQGNCLPSVHESLKRLHEQSIPIVQAHWKGQQLGLLNTKGAIVRINPSIADNRIAAQSTPR